MRDSGSDGWSGYILGIRQDNAIVGTFGDKFTSGASSGPVYITVQGDQFAQIVVINIGTNAFHIGFVVKAPNGTVIHQRGTGTSFAAGIIFSNFCPKGGCPDSPYSTFSVTLTDSGSDGWNGNALVILQNKVAVANLGLEFKSKGTLGPFSVVLQGNLPAQIVVGYLGTKTNEVGYTVRAPNGTIILTRTSGSTFKGGNVLSTFCPISNCLNLVTLTIR